jgi:hypothetical protein
MPTLPQRAAAYTRTSIFRRFLSQLSDALPQRVDNRYAETRLGLKGGDVRAFLQSLRVLGFVDPYGNLTERARRSRAATQRPVVIREALTDAYPELLYRWEGRGGMSRQELEDFFKVEYGLSTSSAGPAAKLFEDLMNEYVRQAPREAAPLPLDVDPDPEPAARPFRAAEVAPEPPPALVREPGASDVRVAALDAMKSSLKIEITADWDPEKIDLVFNRMEHLMDRILRAG